MKPNGDWEPIDECRDAWKKRVTVPHAEFEILLTRHMGRGLGFSEAAFVAEDKAARASTAAVRAAVTTILEQPVLRTGADVAPFFADDGHFGADLRSGLAAPGPAAHPVRAAWAAQALVAGLYDNMPPNLWCAHPRLQDAFMLALEDISEPGSHFFASDLTAVHRLQSVLSLMPALPVAIRKLGLPEQPNLARLCAYTYAFVGSVQQQIVATASKEFEAQMRQPGVTPLRRLNSGPA